MKENEGKLPELDYRKSSRANVKAKIPGLDFPGCSIIHNGVIEWYVIEEEMYYQLDPETGNIRKRYYDQLLWSRWEEPQN